MQYKYIRYSDLDHQVVQLVGTQVYELNKHYLPEIAITCRERFLEMLQRCNNIHTAYAIVRIGQKLPEVNFKRFSNYMLATQQQGLIHINFT